MSTTDATLTGFLDSEFRYTPLALRDRAPRILGRELDAWDMSAEWLGAQPASVGFDEYRRFQYDRLYFYPRRTGEDVSYAPVEFRVYVDWVGTVPDALERHLAETTNAHLRTLFNTGIYQGWMDGYTFEYHASNRESSAYTRIGADEASNLGVVQWEVLVFDQSRTLRGSAAGFADPWMLTEFRPDQEVWNVTKNPARGSYEIRPPDRARQRLMGQRKEVYLNGRYIGNTVPSRGTVWLKNEYGTKDETYKDRNTGQQMWSRRKLIDGTAMTAQGVRAGGKVYKVAEDGNAITLVPTAADTPPGFDPTPSRELPETVAEEALRLALDEDCTTFEVVQDQGDQLGKYAPPEVRTICQETDWNTSPSPF